MDTRTRYYRGYNFKWNPTMKVWDICWGEKITSAATISEAEVVVDNWLNAR